MINIIYCILNFLIGDHFFLWNSFVKDERRSNVMDIINIYYHFDKKNHIKINKSK